MANMRYPEVDAVIAYIQDRLYEPLTLEELAKYASYSPYHFTRVFKQRMGLTPQYYVSAMRLQRAKDLLLRTNYSVRDIAYEIGQQSLGTFTTRFASRVGTTPADFRNSAERSVTHLRSLRKLNHWAVPHAHFNRLACVQGAVRAEAPFEGVILVGLFPKPIPEGMPLYGTTIHASPGSFCFTDVKPGTYYLMATSLSWGMNAVDVLLPSTTLRTRDHQPLVVTPFTPVPYQEVRLYPPSPTDPPILISLSHLMSRFLSRTGHE